MVTRRTREQTRQIAQESRRAWPLFVPVIVIPSAIIGILTPVGPALLLAAVIDPSGLDLHLNPRTFVFVVVGNIAWWLTVGILAWRAPSDLRAVAWLGLAGGVPMLALLGWWLSALAGG